MRKHFLILMLLALLPLAGFAQFQVNNYVRSGNYIYQIKTASDGVNPGKVKLIGIVDGKNPVGDDKVLNLKGKITISLDDEYSVDFYVNDAADDAIKKTYSWKGFANEPTVVGDFAGRVEAESVVIPKEFLKVKKDFFYGYTNMKAISFEENSEVTEIESGAFNTTQIRKFDFSNCSKLATLNSGVFVQEGTAVNSYVTTITLPEQSEALTDISTAFQRLPNLTEIKNLDKSLITTVVLDAFKGDTKLETLELPGTVQTIANGAFAGSGIKNLTIDVTSLNDPANFSDGNYYTTAAYDADNVPADYKTLETLTLKGTLSGVLTASAFRNCVNLKSINMDELTINGGTIGAYAFLNCAELTSLTFTNGISGIDADNKAVIGQQAFKDCKKLATISFGDLQHVTIAEKAFENLASLGTLSVTDANKVTFGTLTDVEINASAFEGGAKLKAVSFGDATNLQIGESAFKGATELQSVTFGNITDERANVTTVTEIGNSAFAGATKLQTIKFGKLTGVKIDDSAFLNASSLTSTNVATITFQNDLVNSVIASHAFKGASKVKTITFKNLDASTIETLAFENVGSALNVYGSVSFGNLENGSQIADNAFTGASKLNTVTIGDITDSKIGSAGTAAVFPAVKEVTIGAVKSTTDATQILAKAFTFANQSRATLILGKDKAALETVAGATNTLIAADAFDFTTVNGGTTGFVNPVITIGELKTAKVFAAGALKGNKIAKITFDGNIAAGALDVMIVTGYNSDTDNNDVTKLTELKTLDFNGEIATGGIVANAFATLPAVMTITFNGKLASLAVADGAFEKLVDASQVVYAYNGADIDLTVNPFGKRVFDKTTSISGATTIEAVDAILARTINLSIVNDALKAAFKSSLNGLGTYDGTFAIYKVIYADPVVVDLSFKVYPDIKTSRQDTTTSPRTAWARWELGARVDANVTGTLAANTDLVIKRVQQVDGTNNAKITIYGTYTDEDDALKASTVYMVPLKVTNGYYHIPGDNKTTLIVKVENPADFVETSYKVKVNEDLTNHPYSNADNSIWTGLENKELFVASNIMTNQQLIDNLAVDAAVTGASTNATGYYHDVNNIDIYRGTYGTTNQKIVENLYIMADPSKNTGFRIDMNPITDENDAYINKGWYYMLLKKYDNATAARVIWMDDATESDVTAILSAKSDAKNVVNSNAIYTLQGVRVSQMQKGQIYIVNGKKYLAK